MFYQTFTGIWPEDSTLTGAICAILNGPIANAFVSTIEGKIDITVETLGSIPVPDFTIDNRAEIGGRIETYNQLRNDFVLGRGDVSAVELALKRIDAAVLRAYDLPPRVERELLDYFNDSPRIVPFEWHDYYPKDFEPCFPLREFLSDDFKLGNASEWRRDYGRLPEVVHRAMSAALRAYGAEE